MKLSEAILLGSTVVTPKAGALHFYGENAGCALGMAAIASGCTFSPAQRLIPVKDLRTVNVEDIWGPWLLRVVIRPCDCRAAITLRSLRLKEITAYLFDRGSGTLPRGMRIKDIIAHLFDQHVMGKRDWTLDQLVGWLEGWELTELGQNTLIAHVSRKSLSPMQWHDLSDDATEWQKTCEAFEAKVNAKRRRGPSDR
jgi:hypothetical protein